MSERVDGGASIVTAFLRHRSDVLLVRRDEGRWDGLSAPAAGDPDGRVRAAVREATGLAVGAPSTGEESTDASASLVRAGDPVRVAARDAESDRADPGTEPDRTDRDDGPDRSADGTGPDRFRRDRPIV
ncbi:hypothetical protein GJ633_13800, partial [Halorubrum sp. CBA1125]|nr:hypothetical protein [Halorubrum sp. CBA1125]